MSVSHEQLKEDMGRIIRSNPIMHLATVSIYESLRVPHSSSVWFAPDSGLERIFWLSSPTRKHSEDIDSFKTVGDSSAPVSGSMNLMTRPSQPVLGLSFEGKARRLDDRTGLEEAVGILLANRVFFPDEASAYLEPPEDSAMPTHAAYVAEISAWTHFDGTRSPEERKSVFSL